jgi:hypothetical protein
VTEEQIEIRVELMVDHLDAKFMHPETGRPTMSDEEYETELKKIDAWAEEQRRRNRWVTP